MRYILIIPIASEAEALFHGACNARPPTVSRQICTVHGLGNWTAGPASCNGIGLSPHTGRGKPERALALAWDGRFERFGALRMAEWLARIEGFEPDGKHLDWVQARNGAPSWRLVIGNDYVDYRQGTTKRFAKATRRWSIPGLSIPSDELHLLGGSIRALALVCASRGPVTVEIG